MGAGIVPDKSVLQFSHTAQSITYDIGERNTCHPSNANEKPDQDIPAGLWISKPQNRNRISL